MEPDSFSSQKVNTLFTGLAPVYDPLNKFFTLGADAIWRKHLVRSIPYAQNHSGVILDLGAGTMEVSMQLARQFPEATILALDICLPMLCKGQPKRRRLAKKNQIIPVLGDAKNIPMHGASASAVTLAFGLRNMAPRSQVLAEVFRVLKPGGYCCILEFGSVHDKACFGIYNFYLAKILPVIGVLLSRKISSYRYLVKSVEAFPSSHKLTEEMHQTGFENIHCQKFTAGCITLHTGRKPN